MVDERASSDSMGGGGQKTPPRVLENSSQAFGKSSPLFHFSSETCYPKKGRHTVRANWFSKTLGGIVYASPPLPPSRRLAQGF